LGKELVPDETAAKKKKAQKAALVDLSPFANHLTASENAVSKYRYHPSASSVKAPVLPALSISPKSSCRGVVPLTPERSRRRRRERRHHPLTKNRRVYRRQAIDQVSGGTDFPP